MLNKQLFKDEMVKLLSIHGIKIDKIPVDMLRIWYEELKELRDEDFIASVKKVKFSPKLSLYYILINLPDFDKEKHKDVHDYCNRKYNKPSISFGLNNSEFDGR